ncbi:MAG: hypothetical protein Q4A65_05975 [Bacillota bacterium]|nr:hypothetical protein [Bacillota bacterium]
MTTPDSEVTECPLRLSTMLFSAGTTTLPVISESNEISSPFAASAIAEFNADAESIPAACENAGMDQNAMSIGMINAKIIVNRFRLDVSVIAAPTPFLK